jgi:hypothetical protein
MITFKWELSGFNGELTTVVSSELPCIKKSGVFYPDTSNLNAIYAFNPHTGESMTVKEFRAIDNLFMGGWNEKVNEGWSLIKIYKFVETSVENTNYFLYGTAEPLSDIDDDYWF